MCGISGYWGIADHAQGRETIRAMNGALIHRGPDGEGVWTAGCAGLGHRRLAIIDLVGGAQPMTDATGRYTVVLNGEIYNYKALRAELIAAGYAFRTNADTEAIAAAIDHWGLEPALLRLRGMFAFALYDGATQSLTLARDRVGIKPLYLARSNGALLFASEPKALLAAVPIPNRIDAGAVLDFFTFGETFAPRTAWTSIAELEPGTWLRVDRAGTTSGKYWRWRLQPVDPVDEGRAVDELEAVLVDSLRAHLEADVPVAAFLSGGIDSSTLVALMRKHLVQDIETFTVGFGDRAYDESAHAIAVAKHCGVSHHVIRLDAGGGDPGIFSRIIEQFDQPFGDSSALPTWFVCREMARHGKVVISGDGGDEMFGGYERYRQARTLARIGAAPGGAASAALASRLLRPFDPERARQIRKIARLARLPRKEMLGGLLTYFTPGDLGELLNPELLAAGAADGAIGGRFHALVPDGSEPAEQLMTAEVGSILPGDYLRKLDVTSMAHGLEVRTPFLDAEVFAFSQRLPTRLKVRRGSMKHLLRQVARRHLPAGVIDRPKQGFGLPLDRWAGPDLQRWIRDLLTGPDARNTAWLRPLAVRQVLERFEAGVGNAELSRYQAYQRVFLLSSFELWLRRWGPAL